MIRICVYLFILSNFHSILCTETETLELVHVVFRHGHRTPEQFLFYPKDPHVNVSFHPIGYGQLTNAGKTSAFNLGKELRERYKGFLDPFTVETVDARSTDMPRTKMSLQLVLAGLFPPENGLVWNKELQWQPIPTSYTPLYSDHVLGPAARNCPRYHQLYWQYKNSKEGRNVYQNYTESIKYVAEHTGIQNVTGRSIFNLYFLLAMEEENGLPLPEWTHRVYPDTLEKMTLLEYDARVATPELVRLASGFLLKKIAADTKLKIEGGLPNTKIFLYSGHEFNIMPLLKLLEVQNQQIALYGAYILIEIHNIEGVRKVKVFHQNYQSKNLQQLEFTNCPDLCEFEQFVQLHENSIPTSEDECKTKS